MASLVELVEPLPLRFERECFLLSDTQVANVDAALASCSRQLRSLVNSRAAVNCLPPEILKLIFDHVVVHRWLRMAFEPAWTSEYLSLDPSNYSSVIPATTQVCRYWRGLALRTPSLWRILDPTAPIELRDLLFERSAGAQLTVNVSYDVSPWLKSKLISDCGRVKELSAQALRASQVVDLVDFPAPMLQIASVEQSRRRQLGSAELLLFRGDAPRLFRLFLMNITWRPINAFGSLAQLYLRNCKWSQPLRSLAQLLCATPNLVDLVLHQMDVVADDTDINIPRARLVKLERLTLTLTSSTAIRNVLKIVQLGSQTSVSMYGDPHAARDPHILDDIRISKGMINDAPYKFYLQHNLARAGKAHCILAGTSSAILCENMSIDVSENSVRLGEVDYYAFGFPQEADTSSIRDAWIIEPDKDDDDDLGFFPEDMLNFLRRLANVESLTMLSPTFSLFTAALALSPTPDACKRLSSMHILFYGSSSAPALVLESLAADQDLHVRNVTIGYLPGFKNDRVFMTEFDAYFDSVEYVSYTQVPRMDLPPTCTVDPHSFWPQWPLSSWTREIEKVAGLSRRRMG
ncbi:uncharacterized protein B0H18DRAFT_991005 [Fomitopsis serialis]|uniref:uncharacterized protein n=1 Tax=Fomitopsis serialis TaxID=139415 RepID=UPI0020089002|nr:uncharacterized protein B0H18DRAFT_991005 [Neoantrodia serialis]KAH9931290.1 hypothetical protein B0H18DRAFT_991005 [Neoantrodia serialis]